jgi:hypothetical protein
VNEKKVRDGRGKIVTSDNMFVHIYLYCDETSAWSVRIFKEDRACKRLYTSHPPSHTWRLNTTHSPPVFFLLNNSLR